MPAAYGHALDTGLADIGVVLAADQREAIDGHVRLLLAWNDAVNLTRIREPAAMAIGHVVDSLTALPVLRARSVDRFVDLGSGGGYPGLPLAIAAPAHAVLADSIGKKVRFLDALVDALELRGRVETYAGRAETLARDGRHRERWPAVTTRAVASMPELTELAFPLLAPGGVVIAWKRGDMADELAAARRAVAALGGGSLETRDVVAASLSGHCLVIARKDGRTPNRYPRDTAQRRRSPW